MRFHGCREKGVTSENTRRVHARLGSVGCSRWRRQRRQRRWHDARERAAPRHRFDSASFRKCRRRDRRIAVHIQLGTTMKLARFDARDHGVYARGKADPTAQTGTKERLRRRGAWARGARRGLIWPEGLLCSLRANFPLAKGGCRAAVGRDFPCRPCL